MNVEERLEPLKVKRIHVFENGVSTKFEHTMLISPIKERTWNQVLTSITQTLQPSYGTTHHLMTIDGTASVHSITELTNGARYVACGREQFKNIKYRTKSEFEKSSKKKYLKLYAKETAQDEDQIAKFWALEQAQKNKRTIIYVFANGRNHQIPAKLVLIEPDLQNWPRTLSHIANKLDKPEGVRYLYTIFGQRVRGPCELQHGASYVATAFREKFNQLDYMGDYKEVVVTKAKTGGSVRNHHIAPVSSPIGVEQRNTDCFFASKDDDATVKQDGAAGKEKRKSSGKKKKAKLDDISKGMAGSFKSFPSACSEDKKNLTAIEHVECSQKITSEEDETPICYQAPKCTTDKEGNAAAYIKALDIQEGECSDNISLKNNDPEEESEIGNNSVPNAETSEGVDITSPSIEPVEINRISSDVTVEEVGIKIIVTSTCVDNADQGTQTQDSELDTVVSSKVKLPLLTRSPECGLRIVGADAIMLQKQKTSTTDKPAQPLDEKMSEILENHSKVLQKRLSELSMISNKIGGHTIEKIRESKVSFDEATLWSHHLSDTGSKIISNPDVVDDHTDKSSSKNVNEPSLDAEKTSTDKVTNDSGSIVNEIIEPSDTASENRSNSLVVPENQSNSFVTPDKVTDDSGSIVKDILDEITSIIKVPSSKDTSENLSQALLVSDNQSQTLAMSESIEGVTSLNASCRKSKSQDILINLQTVSNLEMLRQPKAVKCNKAKKPKTSSQPKCIEFKFDDKMLIESKPEPNGKPNIGTKTAEKDKKCTTAMKCKASYIDSQKLLYELLERVAVSPCNKLNAEIILKQCPQVKNQPDEEESPNRKEEATVTTSEQHLCVCDALKNQQPPVTDNTQVIWDPTPCESSSETVEKLSTSQAISDGDTLSLCLCGVSSTATQTESLNSLTIIGYQTVLPQQNTTAKINRLRQIAPTRQRRNRKRSIFNCFRSQDA